MSSDDLRCAVAIATLPSMTPQRLRRILRGRDAAQVFEEIRTGSPAVARALAELRPFAAADAGVAARRSPPSGRPSAQLVAALWTARARVTDPEKVWASIASAGIAAARFGGPGYPSRLADPSEPEAPEILFSRGSPRATEGPTAALVGTRKATHYGQEVAAELGAGLARAGVSVVSGLALGIDAAAHEGALASLQTGAPGPVGVLGGGVDVAYPSRNARLIDRVAEHGCLLSEAPPGSRPDAWRFPMRNRIIAALAQVLVVVESPRHGGAMHTVEAASARDRPVLAVPGSVRSEASEGTNELIAAGALVARDVYDVLVAIERQCAAEGSPPPKPGARGGGRTASAGAPGSHDGLAPEAVADRLERCSTSERAAFRALDEHPTTVDTLCNRSGLGLGDCALALDRLHEIGLAQPVDGGWVRR